MVRFCRHCGKELSETANFCSGCGAKTEKAAPPKKQFCRECGRELAAGSAFCGGCGTKVGEAPSVTPPPVQTPRYSAPQQPPKKAAASKKNPLPVALSVLAFAIVMSLFVWSGFVKGGNLTKIGKLSSDGYSLTYPADTFKDGSKVEVMPVAESELYRYRNDEKYELVGMPLEISSDGYMGDIFTADMKLTLPMPKKYAGGLEKLAVLYFDEYGDVQYMLPDSYDSRSKTVSINLPHFSAYSLGALTDEELTNLLLDRYAAQEAISRADGNQAAAELAPYIRAQIENLELTEAAERELTVAVINEIGGKFGDDAGAYTDLATTVYKCVDDNDTTPFADKMKEIISTKLMNIVEYNVFNGNAEFIFKDQFKMATVLGALAGGDRKTAYRELGDAIGGFVPSAGLTAKAIGYVGAKVNESYVNWKANNIEDLYQKFKNGYDGLFGNHVYAEDEESLKRYIFTPSGLSGAPGIYRLYNGDKIKELCEMYGWGRKDYDKLDEHYRNIFDQRAEEGLMNYFRTRLAEEKEAANIKETDRAGIEEMLQVYGCLKAGNYNKFFGEHSKDDYDPIARLDRIIRVKKTLEQYVDANALAASQKKGVYNWGVLMNDWIESRTESSSYEKALEKFIEKLRSYDLLSKTYKADKTDDEPDIAPGEGYWKQNGVVNNSDRKGVYVNTNTLATEETSGSSGSYIWKYTYGSNNYCYECGHNCGETGEHLTLSLTHTAPKAKYAGGATVTLDISASVISRSTHACLRGGTYLVTGISRLNPENIFYRNIGLEDADGNNQVTGMITNGGYNEIHTGESYGESRSVSAEIPKGKKAGDKIYIVIAVAANSGACQEYAYEYVWTVE